MEERFDKMRCSNCGMQMQKGITVQGYQHPLVWSPGRKAITYSEAVKLTYSNEENLKSARRFTSLFGQNPAIFRLGTVNHAA